MATGAKLRVITCAYNPGRWLKRCLASIQAQGYPDFRCIVIDDGSTDGSLEQARALVGGDDRFEVHDAGRVGSALENRAYGIRKIATDPDDVIIVVDADDWLAHDDVFQHVADIYADPAVWLTYGSHVRYRGTLRDRLGLRLKAGEAQAYPAPIIEHNLFRYHRFRASHLRTFRQFLWMAIREEDLKNPDGSWIGPAGDVADMVPMLEMAGGAHIRYLRETLYIYNDATSLSDRKINRDAQVLTAARLTARPPYEQLARKPLGQS